MVAIQVPLNVSGFWIPQRGETWETTGSLGASLTIEPPAVFRVTRGSCPVLINGTCIEDYHSIARELALAGLSVCGTSPVPLGVGSAVSGALAIALAYAYLYTKEGGEADATRVGVLAHRIEIETGGGLGDIICQVLGGGLLLRRKPGPPGVGEAIPLPTEDVEVTLGVLENRITTREMLQRYAEKFADVGPRVYGEFLAKPDLRNFLRLSREFSIAVGFMRQEMLERLEASLRDLQGEVIGYFAKKSLLVVVHRPGAGLAVRRAIERVCSYSLPSFKLAKQGFTVAPWG